MSIKLRDELQDELAKVNTMLWEKRKEAESILTTVMNNRNNSTITSAVVAANNFTKAAQMVNALTEVISLLYKIERFINTDLKVNKFNQPLIEDNYNY